MKRIPMKPSSNVSRRLFMQVGAVGGLTLPQLLRLQETCATETAKQDINCIFLFIVGGMPHQDMWDLKPHAPAEIRGDFEPIATSVAGIVSVRSNSGLE